MKRFNFFIANLWKENVSNKHFKKYVTQTAMLYTILSPFYIIEPKLMKVCLFTGRNAYSVFTDINFFITVFCNMMHIDHKTFMHQIKVSIRKLWYEIIKIAFRYECSVFSYNGYTSVFSFDITDIIYRYFYIFIIFLQKISTYESSRNSIALSRLAYSRCTSNGFSKIWIYEDPSLHPDILQNL